MNNFNITDDLDRKIIQNVLNDNIKRSRFSFVKSEDDKSDDLTHKSDNSIKEILLNSLSKKISNSGLESEDILENLKRKFSLNSNDDKDDKKEFKGKKLNFNNCFHDEEHYYDVLFDKKI